MRECKIKAGKGRVVVGREKLENFFTYDNEIKYRVITKEVDGFWVTIPNEMGSETTFVRWLSSAFDLIGKFDNEADAINKRAKEIGNYIVKNELY